MLLLSAKIVPGPPKSSLMQKRMHSVVANSRMRDISNMPEQGRRKSDWNKWFHRESAFTISEWIDGEGQICAS